MNRKIFKTITLVLGVISAMFVFLDYLALTDIWHNREPDLSMEWTIVSVSVIPIALFYISFFITNILAFIKPNGNK